MALLLPLPTGSSGTAPPSAVARQVGFWGNLRIFVEISGLKCLIAGSGKCRCPLRVLRALQIRDGKPDP